MQGSDLEYTLNTLFIELISSLGIIQVVARAESPYYVTVVLTASGVA